MPNRDPVIRFTAMPADANAYGDIFGVWRMSLMDMSALGRLTPLPNCATIGDTIGGAP